MKPKRGHEILSAGFKVAKDRIEAYPTRPDYPHDYNRLYCWLEDKLFNLYSAICRKNYKFIRNLSGEVIITASEIAEYTDMQLEVEKHEEE